MYQCIKLNEETLWSGYFDKLADNPECARYLPEMRKLLFEGRIGECEELAMEYLRCRGSGAGYKLEPPFPNGSHHGSYEDCRKNLRGNMGIPIPSAHSRLPESCTWILTVSATYPSIPASLI